MRTYSAALVGLLASTLSIYAQTFQNDQAARAVFGQTNFTAGNNNPSQQILGGASGLAYANGTLWVADSNRVAAGPNNNRILAFQTSLVPGINSDITTAGLTNTDCYLCGFPAYLSLGQTSFTPTDTTTGLFDPGLSQSTLHNATGVATDGHYFAVADTDNNRVLLWNEIPTVMGQNADLVLGQPDFTTLQANFGPTFASASSLRGPQGVWIQNGKLFVADTQNNRVLIWNSWPTHNNQNADLVLGQTSFNTNTSPSPTITAPSAAANQLENPTSVTSDGTHLFVSDLGFNRVLIWNSIPTTMDQNADVAVGQPDLTQTTFNNPNVCAGYNIGPVNECRTSLNFPRFALSNGTKLFVADGGNDRVLIWDTIPTASGAPADEVLGQPDFIQDVESSASISIASTAIDNTGGVDLVPTPQGLAWDGTNLYVSDAYNRRVLIFTPGVNTLAPNSVVNWASEIVRQEGIVSFSLASTTSTITTGDIMTVTIAGTAYTYTIVKNDTFDSIAQGVIKAINSSNSGAGDPDVTAIFAGTGSGSLYLSSKATNLAYDTISLSATSSNSLNEVATASGSYLSSGTAATATVGMLVEINGTNLADYTATADANGTNDISFNLGGVQVYMDGAATPLYKVSPNQIVTQVPWYFSDRNSTSVYVRTVHSDGSITATNAVPVYIAPANPGIFNAPAYAGQPRPWPIAQAYHQPGNATSVIDVDGSIKAGDTGTITVQGVNYPYTVVSTDTLTTVAQAFIKLINASDKNVTASYGGAFNRVVLTANQPGAAGVGITVSATAGTGAVLTLTAYNSATCCLVTPGTPITPSNPAGPGELIQVSAVGLGLISNPDGSTSPLGAGDPYNGVFPNTAQSFVSATMGGTTAQVIFADLPLGSYGTYNVEMVVPTTATTNATTTLNIAQNAFISNTVTIPVGPTALYVPPPPTAPPSYVRSSIDTPSAGSTVSGAFYAAGWALNTQVKVTAVNVSIDGAPYGTATRAGVRNDACAVYGSPDCPNVGWYIGLDTTQFADGQHTFAITTVGADGTSYTNSQNFSIANGSTAADQNQHAVIDAPALNLTYRGTVNFSGWALNDNAAVASVNLFVDGTSIGTAAYGVSRPDVCAVFPGRAGCPNVGWLLQYDTTRLADGGHTLVAKALSANGQTLSISRNFQVGNFSTANNLHASIDAPSAGAGAFSGVLAVGGWAADDSAGVASVDLSVDGVSYGATQYGFPRPDACAVVPTSPNCPNVGFNSLIDTTLLADGAHTLTITVNPQAGQSATYSVAFSVANQATSANPVSGSIDAPSSNATESGMFYVAGWAAATIANDSVTNVALLVDGKSVGNAVYGSARPDVCGVFPNYGGCPNSPNFGWSSFINSTLLTNGPHVLEATFTTASGQRASIGRMFQVSNATTGEAGHLAIDVPNSANNPFTGLAFFSGWAVNDNSAVSSVSVTIDGVPYGSATYPSPTPRPDVCAIHPDAGCPNVGWTYGLDTTQLTDGLHTLGITENDADGTFHTISEPFTVANYTPVNPLRIQIDAPGNTSYPLFGTNVFGGWAIDSNVAISSIAVAVDGVAIGNATYGVTRNDVCAAFGGEPGCPNVGWDFIFNTSLIPNGTHTLDITATTAQGQSSTATQQFSVAN